MQAPRAPDGQCGKESRTKDGVLRHPQCSHSHAPSTTDDVTAMIAEQSGVSKPHEATGASNGVARCQGHRRAQAPERNLDVRTEAMTGSCETESQELETESRAYREYVDIRAGHSHRGPRGGGVGGGSRGLRIQLCSGMRSSPK